VAISCGDSKRDVDLTMPIVFPGDLGLSMGIDDPVERLYMRKNTSNRVKAGLQKRSSLLTELTFEAPISRDPKSHHSARKPPTGWLPTRGQYGCYHGQPAPGKPERRQFPPAPARDRQRQSVVTHPRGACLRSTWNRVPHTAK